MTTNQRGVLTFCMLLAAGAVPLRAQFVVTGCPNGVGGTLNGFTAGTQSPSQICLTGTFSSQFTYMVTLTSPLQTITITGVKGNNTVLLVNVPPTFYPTVSTAGQPDPVNVSSHEQNSQTQNPPQTGTFQVNPPLQAGGPILYSAVNTPVSWTLFSGGTPPYSDQFYAGNVPPGMPGIPASGTVWSGTPTQAGVFQFTITPTDAWGNAIMDDLAAYIVPVPQLTSLSPNTAAVGSPNTTLTINGSNFLSPRAIGAAAAPGATVQVVSPSGTIVLTPTAYAANQLTVTLPSTVLATTGILSISVINPGQVASSNALPFAVTPYITALSPNIRTAGTNPSLLGVTGAGFVNGSAVRLNGTALPTTFLNAASLSATLPTVNTPGQAAVTVMNPDGTVSPAATLTILPQPVIRSLNPTSVTAGGSSFVLTVTGANFLSGMTVFFNFTPVATTLVNNQAFNQLTAAIPAAAIVTAGTVPVSVVTPDGYSTPGTSFTIAGPTVPPLQLVNFSPLPSGVVSSVYSTAVTATGGTPPYAFSLSAGTWPAGLTFSPAGLLSGTPTALGTSKFTLQVADSTATTYTRDYTLTIGPTLLSLTTGPLANSLQNVALSVQFAGSGGVPPYTFLEFGTLPPGTQFSSSGLFSGTPTKAGTYPFQVFINDSSGASASKPYSITIGQPGLLITPPSPLPAGQLATPYTTQLSATGGAGAPYRWSATGIPAGLTIANNSGLITGIPQVAGAFTIAVTIIDANGLTVTQNYSLTIASSNLSIVTTALSNGAVGSPYSAAVAAAGGSGSYNFSATGLPPGLTVAANGIVSGTPTAAGSFTIAVTVTDTQSNTAKASFPVTITSSLVVTGATISNAVLGTPITATTLKVTGGTPPYQWQTASAPPGLSLSSSGTLSGTPTVAGTFSFLAFVVDNNGALGSATVNVTVALPSAPALTLSGIPATNAPASQPSVQVALANPFPAVLTVNLTLTFAPDSGPDDPSVQFATGGRTTQIVVPANNTGGLTAAALQTGTVAGTITITAQLLAGAQNVTPTPTPSLSVRVNAAAPVISSITATRNSTGFTVVLDGFSSSRDLSTGTFQFSGSAGANLLNTQVTTADSSLFTQWYQSTASAPFGSQFSLTQPFTVTGSPSAVLSVTVTLTNSVGTSLPVTVNLQ